MQVEALAQKVCRPTESLSICVGSTGVASMKAPWASARLSGHVNRSPPPNSAWFPPPSAVWA